MKLGAVLDRVRSGGFVGPAYSGWIGKARFAFEELVARTEVVLVAEPESVKNTDSLAERVELRFVDAWDALAGFEAEIDGAYHSGYVARWRGPFERGERLVLALTEGHVAGFGWLQTGTPEGVPCHYALIKTGEFRILRVGVLPAYRRRGINSGFYALLLRELFSQGARRVYIDSSRNNVASLRAQRRAGFRTVGEILVRGRLFGSGVIRWRSARE